MDAIRWFLEFLTNSNHKISTKAWTIITSVFLILLLNNIFGFSYYYSTSRKIEHVKEISTLLKDSTLNPSAKVYLSQQLKDVLNRQNFIEQTTALLKPWFLQLGSPLKIPSLLESTKHSFWVYLSSTFSFVFLIFFVVVLLFISPGNELPQSIFSAGVAIVILVVLANLAAKFASFIPAIFGIPLINYIIYAGFNVLLLSRFPWGATVLEIKEWKRKRAQES